jgi:hypothetical protein
MGVVSNLGGDAASVTNICPPNFVKSTSFSEYFSLHILKDSLSEVRTQC